MIWGIFTFTRYSITAQQKNIMTTFVLQVYVYVVYNNILIYLETFLMQAFRKFLPLFDRVLVERFTAETVTKGGIMLPEKSQGKVLQAMVKAVGPGSVNQVGFLNLDNFYNCCFCFLNLNAFSLKFSEREFAASQCEGWRKGSSTRIWRN